MLFKIIKKAPNSFWHLYNNGSKEVNLSDFEVVLDSMAQTFNIQCLNGANVPNQSVEIANIRVIDQTAGSLEESFANVSTLKDRLTTLGYTPYKSSTGIEEAPVDGNIYGRKNEGWITITSGGGSLFALPFTTNHLTATGNQYTVGNVVFYNGNVYRCIAANDSILPTNTLYWTNLGAGYPLVQEPADWNATSGNNQILNKPTIQSNQTLAEVLAEGNTTGGENIVIDDADSIQLENTSSLQKGTYNFGGNGGISRICSNNYEDMWQNGFRHVFDQSGFIRNSTNCFDIIPDETFDETLRFRVDSLWTLDNGTTYKCTDATTGAAVWELVNTGITPTLQEVTDAGNVTTNPILLEDTGLQVEIGSSAGFPYFKMLNIESGQATLFDNSDNTDSRYAKFQDKNGTLAYMDDITTPTLQEVLDNNHDLVDGNFYAGTDAGLDNIGSNVNALGFEAAKNNEGESVNAFGASAASDNIGSNINALGINAGLLNEGSNVNALGSGAGNANTFNHVNLFGENATADEDGQTVLSKDDTIMARISTTDLTATRKYNLPDADGTLALTTDIPTLQEVTTEGNETTIPIKVIDTGNSSAQLQQNGIVFDDLDDLGSTFLSFQQNSEPSQQVVEIRPLGGTMALLSDIPTGSGIPHATAAGTDTYTATITGVTAYNDADAYLIRFTNGNTTGATLNINSLGAIPLYRNNDGVLIGGDIINGGEMLCVYNSTNNHFQVIGTAPNSLFAYVTNDDSVTLTKGMPVYAFGGTGDRMTVKRAYNTLDATSAQTVGLVLSTSIAANQKGLIMMQGLLDGLSILPTSTFADGDAVYLGATAGTITNVKPYAPNHLVYLGVVTTASNGSAGKMYVRIQNGFELSEIHDVDLITNAPTNNQVLTYESSTDLWKNKSIGTILGYTPYRNVQTSQTSITGTTAETIVFTATIPAGTFNSADVLKILFGANKLNSLSTYSLRLRVNTTNTISGSTTIATYTGSATPQVNIITRNFNLNGGNLYGFMFTTSALTDIAAAAGALNSTTLNPANQFFIFATVQLNSINDSIIGNMFTIHN